MNPDLDKLHPYPFEKLATLKSGISPQAGVDHIALSIGEPKHKAPEFVLENLSHERILEFLQRVENWPMLADAYVQSYLDGDLEKLRYMRLRFPSRHHSVIDHRDEIFFERMQKHLAQGDLVAFVGVPHVRGMRKLLLQDGYQVTRARVK